MFRFSATFGFLTPIVAVAAIEIFVAIMDNNGNWKSVFQSIGTPGVTNEGNKIAVDCNGGIYITGGFEQSITFGSLLALASVGSKDIVVAKLNKF